MHIFLKIQTLAKKIIPATAIVAVLIGLFFPVKMIFALANSVPTFERLWGSSGTGQGQFNQPIGVVVNRNGQVYISEAAGHRIQVFDANGNFQFQIGTGTSGAGTTQFNGPQGLAIDYKRDFLYVVDNGNARVVKMRLDGTYLSSFTETASSPGNGTWSNPHGIAVDSETGYVYVSLPGEARVDVHNENGTYLFSFDNSGLALNAPRGMVIKGDQLYLVDQNSAAGLIVFNKNTGAVLRQITITGSPRGIVMDYEGFLFITDRTNNIVRKYHPETGVMLAQYGSTGSGDEQYTGLYNIGADIDGYRFYTTDISLNRIHKHTFSQLPIVNNSVVQQTPNPQLCQESLVTAPEFFRVEREGTKATLYFTPILNIESYILAYGDEDSTDDYGTTFTVGWTDGVQQYTVEKLNPNKKYSFKLAGQNGCATGTWSHTLRSQPTQKLADTGVPVMPITTLATLISSLSLLSLYRIKKDSY